MKIVFNVEKKHLIFFSLFLVFIGSVFVIATTWTPYSSGKPYHEILYTNMIGPVSEDVIEIMGASLKVPSHGKGIIFGNPENQYRIHATAGELNYGDSDTKNVFPGKICSSKNNCVSTEDLINKMKELGVQNTDTIENTHFYGRNNGPIGSGEDKMYREITSGQKLRIAIGELNERKFCEEEMNKIGKTYDSWGSHWSSRKKYMGWPARCQ